MSERKHTSEQKSRRSGGNHVKTDQIKVTLRHTDGAGASKRTTEVQVKGTPRQVVDLAHGLRERRTTTSSSGGSSNLRLTHKSSKEHATSSSVVRRDREPRSSRETHSRIQAPPNSQVVVRTRTYSTTAVKSYGSRSYESHQTSHQASYYSSTCPAKYPSYYQKVESRDVVIRSARHK
ncbi:PREDICTED: uncharacterized protein LOC101298572 [Fragaria vesca subsp. vesca]|uniref:uncharacterized protein LOC101298572 n=1 Tax=Fragaria vesca subsp. vesca TaxID=101020 RepID=UPI0002C30793|nr:PREDICTED: uncharacterized protein LOC101298572 [Fragaria vesca subsp. vesca]